MYLIYMSIHFNFISVCNMKVLSFKIHNIIIIIKTNKTPSKRKGAIIRYEIFHENKDDKNSQHSQFQYGLY